MRDIYNTKFYVVHSLSVQLDTNQTHMEVRPQKELPISNSKICNR
jgi:hypothetical protein